MSPRHPFGLAPSTPQHQAAPSTSSPSTRHQKRPQRVPNAPSHRQLADGPVCNSINCNSCNSIFEPTKQDEHLPCPRLRAHCHAARLPVQVESAHSPAGSLRDTGRYELYFYGVQACMHLHAALHLPTNPSHLSSLGPASRRPADIAVALYLDHLEGLGTLPPAERLHRQLADGPVRRSHRPFRRLRFTRSWTGWTPGLSLSLPEHLDALERGPPIKFSVGRYFVVI
jgi:hypothetical protein